MSDKLKNILISYNQPGFTENLGQLRQSIGKKATFDPGSDEGKKVAEIIEDVCTNKNDAVAKYTEKFDNVILKPEQFRLSQENLEKVHKEINKNLLNSIKKAIANVRRYQEEIFVGKNKKCTGGTGVKYTPIKRVGICVPGASAPLPSTVIMTAVPAQVAGVKEIVIVSPPRYNETIHPVTLAVCYELGITEVYRIGGVQAVAAMTYGTKTVKQVDKIVGPGNQWVQTAKQLAFGATGIDLIAGPSEVLIIADENANPAWVAADMLSQAEHSPGSAVVLTDSQAFGEKVLAEVEKQLIQLSRAEETTQCLNEYSKIVVLETIDDCIDKANEFAAEHLQIQCGDKSREIAGKIENAGAIFIGQYSPVAVGDYWAGPSHTLPTGENAKFTSALSSNDFVKATSIIEYSSDMLAAGSDDIIRLAEAEGLDAHAKSVKIRQQD